MVRLDALPGDPYYDEEGGMQKAIDLAGADVKPETIAAMARIIEELKSEIEVSHGVNVLWGAKNLLIRQKQLRYYLFVRFL